MDHARTRALHAHDHGPKTVGQPLTPPLYLTSSFRFDTYQEGPEVAQGQQPGYVYTRGGNPTTDAAAKAVSVWEEAPASLVLGSGMAAITAGLLSLVRPGDEVLMSPVQYGGTYAVSHGLGESYGLRFRFADLTQMDAVRQAISPATRVIVAETIGNPAMTVPPLDDLGALCRERGIALLVDNTFATGYLYRPLSVGATLVANSATKYMNGHGDTLVGTISGSEEAIARVKTLVSQMGNIASPFAAYMLWRGLATLPLRMDAHSHHARVVAEGLSDGERQYGRVIYPGLPSHSQYHWVHEHFHQGMAGGMIALQLSRDVSPETFMNGLQLFSRAVSLGDTTSLVEQPASLTHRLLTPEEKAAAGIDLHLIRLSIGLEDPDDLLADLRQALAQAKSR